MHLDSTPPKLLKTGLPRDRSDGTQCCPGTSAHHQALAPHALCLIVLLPHYVRASSGLQSRAPHDGNSLHMPSFSSGCTSIAHHLSCSRQDYPGIALMALNAVRAPLLIIMLLLLMLSASSCSCFATPAGYAVRLHHASPPSGIPPTSISSPTPLSLCVRPCLLCDRNSSLGLFSPSSQ